MLGKTFIFVIGGRLLGWTGRLMQRFIAGWVRRVVDQCVAAKCFGNLTESRGSEPSSSIVHHHCHLFTNFTIGQWAVYLECGDQQPLVHTGGFTDLVFHAWWTVEWRSFADKEVPKTLKFGA
jgi:hypothetical protein